MHDRLADQIRSIRSAFFPLLPLSYFALLTANIWLGWPLNAVVATGALQSIPQDLYEAVDIDGAGRGTEVQGVTLPFLRPAMLPYAIYGFVITFNLFHLSYFMSGGGPFGRTELLVTAGVPAGQRAAPVWRRRGLLRLHVLHPADAHADHQQADEGDGQLCRLIGHASSRPGGSADDQLRLSAIDRRADRLAPVRDVPNPRGLARQALLQAICLFVTLTVIFPIIYVFGVALDPRNIARPDGLNLIPPHPVARRLRERRSPSRPRTRSASWSWPSTVSSWRSATSLVSVAFGVSAAYAFSRLRFKLRSMLMIAVLAVLMLPSVAAIAPLYVLLNSVRISGFNLRNSITGVALALISGALPFAIWNLKGYLDTIPQRPGGSRHHRWLRRNQAFRYVILPLAMPALAVTAFLGFVAGWTDFYFSWTVPGQRPGLHADHGPVRDGRDVRLHDAVERAIGLRHLGLAAGIGRVSDLPEVHHRRPGGRGREGLTQ